MKIFTVTTAILLFMSNSAFAEQTVVKNDDPNATEWEPSQLDYTAFNQLVMKLDGAEAGQPQGDKAWFVKFFAPWCGHCQRLAPTWSEFNRLHQDEINVGIVDCTSEHGKELCSKVEVRGYPTLLYFPGKKDLAPGEKAQAYKMSGPRNMEGLEAFSLGGGWKNASEDQQVPVGLQGVESWARWFAVQKGLVFRDIDNAWRQYGLNAYVPPPYHYWIVMTICSAPFLLIVGLLCCLSDEEDEKPQYPQRVGPADGNAKDSKQPAKASPRKGGARADKLD